MIRWTLIWLVGVATVYGGPVDTRQHEGNPLYCDMYDGKPHYYTAGQAPWVAVDVSHYQNGDVRCGDALVIYFPDGQVLEALALDAGYLERYCVEQWGCDKPIVVDVPHVFFPQPGISAPARVVNRSSARRALERRARR
jgi:hypothetical protein